MSRLDTLLAEARCPTVAVVLEGITWSGWKTSITPLSLITIRNASNGLSQSHRSNWAEFTL